MRCLACDCLLSSRESTRKSLYTKEYLDLCDRCYEPIRFDCPVTDNPFHSGQIDKSEIEVPHGEKDEDSET